MTVQSRTITHTKGMALAQGAVVAFIALFVLACYTVLHEGGHAILGLLFGGTITAFDVSFWDLTAHVGLEGEFPVVQRSLISVAGVGLPYLVWATLLLASPRKVDPVLNWLRTVGSLAVINTLLAWIVLPLLFLQGRAFGDDSINFLRHTGAPPLLVSAVALVMYLGAWALFFRRAGSPRALLADLRGEAAAVLAPASVSSLRGLAAVGVVGVALAGAASLHLAGTNPLALPPGYSPVGTVDLSQRAYADEVVHRFTLERETTANLYFVLQDVTAGPMEIIMTGPAGYHAAFLRLPNPQGGIGRATVHPRDLRLQRGDYEIHYTFPRVPGKVTMATKLAAAVALPTAVPAPQPTSPSSPAREIAGWVTGGGDTTPEGLQGAPRRFVYQVRTEEGITLNVAYTAYPPSPVGERERAKIRLDFHQGTIRVGDYLRARGNFDAQSATLLVGEEGDYLQTLPTKP